VNKDSKKNLKSAFVRLNDSLDVEFTICNFKYVEKVSHTNNWDKLKFSKGRALRNFYLQPQKSQNPALPKKGPLGLTYLLNINFAQTVTIE